MRSHKQPTATRKPPAMSVEEELAELLADPTLRPSITFLGLRSDTDSVPDTVSIPGTKSVSDTRSVSDTETVQPIIIYRQNENKLELVSDTETVSGTSS